MCVLLIAVPFLIAGFVMFFQFMLWVIIGGTLMALLYGIAQAFLGEGGDDDDEA